MKIENKSVKRLLTLIFILYILLLLGVVTLRFFNPAQLSQMRTAIDGGVTHNFEIFKTIKSQIAVIGSGYANWNILANTVCFMPFGFLVPLITKKPCGFFLTAFFGLLFSGLIESAQYFFKIGVFDVDDIILNTAGVILGYIAARISYLIFAPHKKR
jgi:glycopeptide antibiotics resistance protein